jgi:hypothetical protein
MYGVACTLLDFCSQDSSTSSNADERSIDSGKGSSRHCASSSVSTSIRRLNRHHLTAAYPAHVPRGELALAFYLI